MSCPHDMALGTCSQCDPFVVQNLRVQLACSDATAKAIDEARNTLTKVLAAQSEEFRKLDRERDELKKHLRRALGKLREIEACNVASELHAIERELDTEALARGEAL